MSGLFGSTTIPGNRLTDIATQTSTVGIPLPFGYGKFPVDGNIIWSAGKPTEHVTKKSQGKGGVKTQEFTYTLSYAIGFCAGPIYGYLTILRQGKVVYTTDPNAAIEDKAFADKWAQKCTMYFGTRTQMPDSTIEAKEGAGKVSAFRDLAYIVLEDDDVTDNGGAVPQYSAVITSLVPSRVTTPPYALESDSSFTADLISTSGQISEPVGLLGSVESGFAMGTIEVRDTRVLGSADLGAFTTGFTMGSATIDDVRVVLDKAQVSKFTADFSLTSVTVD
jgi:hypothetical protein